MAQDIRNMRPDFISASGTSFRLLSVGPLSPPVRAILVATGGTVSITDLEGHPETGVPLTAGTTLPCAFQSIESLGTAVLYGYR